MAEKRVNDTAEIFEIGADGTFHQVGFWFVYGAADVKLERVLAGLGGRDKIFANSAKQLAPDFFIDR